MQGDMFFLEPLTSDLEHNKAVKAGIRPSLELFFM